MYSKQMDLGNKAGVTVLSDKIEVSQNQSEEMKNVTSYHLME